MSADLHFWGLKSLTQKKSIQEKFFLWVDRQNKLEIESQNHQHLILLPNLKEEARQFKLDTTRLYMLKAE